MKKYFKIYGIIGMVFYAVSLIMLMIFICKYYESMKLIDWIMLVEYILFAPAIYLLFLSHVEIMNIVIPEKSDNVDHSFSIGDRVFLKYNILDDRGNQMEKGSIGTVKKIKGAYLYVLFDGTDKTIIKLTRYFNKIID